MTSTALQTPLEASANGVRASPQIDNRQSAIDNPTILLPGDVRIYAKREGDHITGRVEFPYEVGGRTSVRIDYKNKGVPPIDNRQSTIDNPPDAKASARLTLVRKWNEICAMLPDVPRRIHALRVCAEATIKCSARSLQLWARKLDTQGAHALSDQYTAAPRKLLALDSQSATDAVSIAAWWAFRVGNLDIIDAQAMHHAAHARGRAPCLADVLAAIDCYYSYDTDRARFPFKTFARWARYDVETWIGRSRDKVDYRTRLPEDRTPLLGGDISDESFSGVPDARTRKRDTRDRGTRSAIEALRSEPRPEGSGAVSIENRQSAIDNPASVHEAIMLLDDRMRVMLFSAARGDAQARSQAVATMSLWWDRMPESVRNNIAVRSEVWMRAHKGASDRAVRMVQLTMLIAELKRDRRRFASAPVTVGAAL